MTDYALVRSTVEPKESDTESSANTGYLRRNIKKISASGTEGDMNYSPAHYEYEEKTMTSSEYMQYLIAKEQTEAVNNHSDQEAIDNYTMQLMEEGVL